MVTKHKKTVIAVLAGVLLLLIVGLLAGREAKKSDLAHRDWNKIKESGRLKVVTEKSSLGFRLIDNQVEGFSYEIVKAFADSMGLELEVNLVNDLDSAINGLWEHDYDLIALLIPNTTELNNQLNFTVPIITSRLMLIQNLPTTDSLQNELLTDQHQLKDIEITIPANSPHRLRLENLSNEISDSLKIREMEGATVQDLVVAVSKSKVPYTICDELQARKLNRLYPTFDFSMPLGFSQQYGWAVSKKSMGLLDELNKFLNDFLTTNSYWDIYRKYY